MENKCPKCGKKLSPFYLKQTCPNCNINLLYYKLDENLEKDALEAQRQVDSINRFIDVIKRSSINSPILIFRLVLFFLPLAPLCLPVYSDLSLISIITKIIGGGFNFQANLLPLISIALVILISLTVIVSSLFSATKKGLVRNIILSAINLLVFLSTGIVIGDLSVGYYICLAILAVEIIMHFVCDKVIRKTSNSASEN